MASLAEILFGQPSQPSPSPAPNMSTGYSAMQQPMDSNVSSMFQPTNDPAAIEARKQGWLDVIRKSMSDPNVSRAMAFMGAQLLQPRAVGQTGLGQFGSAYVTGRNAYDYGRQAEMERQLRLLKESRDQAQAQATLESTRAGTEGQTLSNQFTRDTMQSKVDKVRVEAEKAALELSTAKSDADVANIMRGYQKRRAQVLADIPDAKMLSAVYAEIGKQGVENDLRVAQAQHNRASAGEAGARAKLAGAQAEQVGLETKDLQGIPATERLQYRTKTGAYSPSASSGATVAGEQVFGRLFEQQNPKPADAAALPTWTAQRAKYVEDRLSNLRKMDADKQRIEAYKLWQIDGGPNSPEYPKFADFARALGLSFTASTSGGAGAGAGQGWSIKPIKGK